MKLMNLKRRKIITLSPHVWVPLKKIDESETKSSKFSFLIKLTHEIQKLILKILRLLVVVIVINVK